VVGRPRQIVAAVPDPELPALTIADLGILREVTVDGRTVVVDVTPTYSGCPALAEIRADISRRLAAAGYEADVRIRLSPPWTTDWITDTGRRKLHAAGIAPPTGVTPVPLQITRRPVVAFPRCGSDETREVARFGATACRALYACTDCGEPFDYVKAI
jgi:ring-1,2-phenylacetyl-CoA epoxidase subunit PaaD